ncbi:sensor domain-containing diguanylate cyclase [Mycolicibacterium gilvum]|uniref:PAS domain S-box/diguanylate cyclase (GGDEF) domain-containing protein n=1 Tax=Mycolicibacterium gilvum (strain DSM 45189 / LMG 24558 / Spyr1) TaxID=278137 RepID=E6TFS8_MYCSR|nr:sensor domain-containing diguanylate cyclase [Mycolicibacterium gilvum]ADU01115.1 PAS domain S-box/diguanylate cyclase (GGDEF) domain-containing protein [Mycolicibacterium gilvum Spyr1]
MATGGDHGETVRPSDADWMPPLSRLLAWTLAVGVVCFVVRGLVHADSWSYAMAWPAIAPQLVALLTSPRRQWPVYLASFAAVQIIPARLVLDFAPELGLLATMTTVVAAALLLHRDQDWVRGRSDSLRSWLRFLVLASAAPLAGAPLGVASLVLNGEVGTTGSELLNAAMAWYLSEAVGIAFLVPLMLRWDHYLRRGHSRREVLWFAAMTALTAGLCAAAITESSFVLMFLSGLPSMAVLIRSGIAGAFAAMIVGPATVLGATFAGYGPFAASLPTPGQAMISAQVFVLGAFTMVVMVAAALEDRTRLAALDNASYKAYELVAELTGDVVILVDAEGNVLRRASPGHEILSLPDGPLTKEAWLDQVHPDDRAGRADFPKISGPGPSDPFRIRKSDGTWGWYVVHSRRTEDGLTVAVLRDVTLEREVQESLTDMANTDPLTGLANRRGLAQHAADLWSRARAAGEQVTALFIDLDHFKSFNDLYGHQAGDECLRRVADVLAHLADDSVCVAARYGGEEFAVVLVGCDAPQEFADGLAAAIRALRIPHLGTDSGMVTISVGVATLRPWHTTDSDAEAVVAELLDRADKALYVAKSRGRNAISIYGDDTALRDGAALRDGVVLLGEQVHHTAKHPREAAGGRHDD